MSAPRDIVIRQFPGMDTESDPLTLGDLMVSQGIMYSPAALDMYGDGSFMQRRPGVRLGTTQGTVPGVIYDLLRAALTSTLGGTFNTGAQGYDALIGLNLISANTFNATTWKVGTLPVIAQGTTFSIGSDGSRLRKLILAGTRRIMVRSAGPSLINDFVEYSNASSEYRYGFEAGPTNPNGNELTARLAIWHKAHLFIFKNTHPRFGSTMIFSDFNNASVWPGNTFDVEPEGTYQVQGAYSTGERLMIGKSQSLFMLTGATAGDFRVVRVSSRYGLGGIRGGDLIGPDTLLVILTESNKPTGTTTLETPAPRNLGIIAGGEMKVIGDRMLTDIRSGVDASVATSLKTWTQLNGALMLPNRQTTRAAQTALFISTKEGGIWKWTLTASVGACCLCEAGGTMYMGCADDSDVGVIKYLDAALADDNGITIATTFAPYVSSPAFRTNEKAIIESITVWASQTSGTAAWTAARRRPAGTYETAVNFRAAEGQSTAIPSSAVSAYRADFTAGLGAQYVNGFRITMPTDGVASKIHKIMISLKSTGGK